MIHITSNVIAPLEKGCWPVQRDLVAHLVQYGVWYTGESALHKRLLLGHDIHQNNSLQQYLSPQQHLSKQTHSRLHNKRLKGPEVCATASHRWSRTTCMLTETAASAGNLQPIGYFCCDSISRCGFPRYAVSRPGLCSLFRTKKMIAVCE